MTKTMVPTQRGWRPLLTLAAAAIALGGAGVQRATAAEMPVAAIGVENEYADVIAQIGGRYVQVSTIMADPNTDPHSFEVSPKIAARVAQADLIVENGLGYDDWADKMVKAAPKAGRLVINVQQLRRLPDNTPNPHLWYDPATMPAVAKAVAAAMAKLQPDHAAYFEEREKAFDTSLQPWLEALAAFKADFPNTPVAVTEPVSDYMLRAAGARIMTPFSLEVANMNGTDPSPQDVTTQNALFNDKKVKVFLYNQQVTDSLTNAFLDLARRNSIPIVGVYETMPTPGYTYQSWMLAEVAALRKAVADKVSTQNLLHK